MLKDLIGDRFKKLNYYLQFKNPYPSSSRRSLMIKELLAGFTRFEKQKKLFFIVGRIFAWRDQGKIIFSDLIDESGKIQLVFNKKETKDFDLLKKSIDIGDFLEVQGYVFKTKVGEKSLLVKKGRILTKSLRPIPFHWYGLEDKEILLRKRYLDILLNQETRDIFLRKSVFWQVVREFLKKEGFLEVETPVLEDLPGGADARPFVTHHNALDQDFYLRISLELPLKKLLVAGYEKVFEIGRVFRNEGIDREHLQDYTQMECYAAYWDYKKLMIFVEKLYRFVIRRTLKTLKTKFKGKTIDWSGKWRVLDYYKVFKKETGLDLKTASIKDLFEKARSLNLNPQNYLGRGRLIDLLFKNTVRPKIWQPTFLIDLPVDISPLAKRKVEEPDKTERFQVMAGGTELGNGFSELNDPLDQRKRFEEQMKLREAGDEEAQYLDEEFLEALEYGMPPAAGFGMSERLFAVLMDRPIRETVIFPLMRRQIKESK